MGEDATLSPRTQQASGSENNKEPNQCVIKHLALALEFWRNGRKYNVPSRSRVDAIASDLRPREYLQAQLLHDHIGSPKTIREHELWSAVHDAMNVGHDRGFKRLEPSSPNSLHVGMRPCGSRHGASGASKDKGKRPTTYADEHHLVTLDAAQLWEMLNDPYRPGPERAEYCIPHDATKLAQMGGKFPHALVKFREFAQSRQHVRIDNRAAKHHGEMALIHSSEYQCRVDEYAACLSRRKRWRKCCASRLVLRGGR